MTPLFIPIETPNKFRGGCSRMTVSPTARQQIHKVAAATRCIDGAPGMLDGQQNCWAYNLLGPWYTPTRWNDYHWDLNVQFAHVSVQQQRAFLLVPVIGLECATAFLSLLFDAFQRC